MVFAKINGLKKVPHQSVKLRKLTEIMKKKLRIHRAGHINKGNPRPMVNKHMMVMRDLMRQGQSFSKSHISAQREYPMVI